MEKDLPKRKRLRLEHFDYNSEGTYFITVCTKEKQCILSQIHGFDENAFVELTSYGVIADRYIKQMDAFYNNLTVDAYVIMPNHIHILLSVTESGQPRTAVPTSRNSKVSRFVSTFKRFCNKEFGENLWQSSFFDHVIRDYKDYEEHLKYICENPIRWNYEKYFHE